MPKFTKEDAEFVRKLMDTVRKALESDLQVRGVKFWLHNKIALCWIQNRGGWKQFVRHRVNEILNLNNKEDLIHFPG